MMDQATGSVLSVMVDPGGVSRPLAKSSKRSGGAQPGAVIQVCHRRSNGLVRPRSLRRCVRPRSRLPAGSTDRRFHVRLPRRTGLVLPGPRPVGRNDDVCDQIEGVVAGTRADQGLLEVDVPVNEPSIGERRRRHACPPAFADERQAGTSSRTPRYRHRRVASEASWRSLGTAPRGPAPSGSSLSTPTFRLGTSGRASHHRRRRPEPGCARQQPVPDIPDGDVRGQLEHARSVVCAKGHGPILRALHSDRVTNGRDGRVRGPAPNPSNEQRELTAFVLPVQEGRVLLARHSYGPPDLWAMLGGIVDHGESIEQAAVRQVREESGLDVSTERVIALADREDLLLVVYRRTSPMAAFPRHKQRRSPNCAGSTFNTYTRSMSSISSDTLLRHSRHRTAYSFPSGIRWHDKRSAPGSRRQLNPAQNAGSVAPLGAASVRGPRLVLEARSTRKVVLDADGRDDPTEHRRQH